jgi:hypothetical protein
MAGGNEPIDDGIDDIAMSREQFAARSRDLDANLVVRRNQGSPRADEIGLAGHREDETVHHPANDGGIGLVFVDRSWIAGGVDDRLRRDCLGKSESAGEKIG